ncbi:L,D-transpeptidase family protein [Lacticaseibacillus brantae]|uniref:L,D-transpeptidase family protein n=1 Tax=Lacticaseibacillus brantae TaxID=943673 RepID=UPI00070C07DE|nr:L,D-transpeptidase family protein [Lacticaseibacillus brantae]
MHRTTKFILGVGAAVLALAGIYSAVSWHYQDRFLPHTEMLGVNIAGKSPEQANKDLIAHFQNQQVKFVEGKQTLLTASGKELGITPNFQKALTALKAKQNPWRWTESVFADTTAKTDSTPIVNQNQLAAYVKTATTRLNQNRQASKNAQIVLSDGAYTVQKEVNGNQFDATKLTKATLTALNSAATSVDLQTTYQRPTVKSTNAAFKDQIQTLNALTSIKARIEITDSVITIPTSLIQTWVNYQNNQIVWNKAAISTYVQKLSKTYGTYGKSLKFQSTKQGKVTVPAGTYGWSIDTNAEVAQLIKDLSAGKNFSHEVAYQGSGYNKDGSVLGNLYIEVDKKNQHEWVYKDGKLLMDTAVVTGKPGQDTPSGLFYVWDKQRNAVLRGDNGDGTKYASPVSYWMPIDYTGVGLHDSPWQPKYGGDWYQGHGSHGCVNTPPSYMAKLFEAIPTGTPVIVI